MYSKNLKKYVDLKKRLEDEDCDEKESDDIEQELEDLYFELSEEEIDYLEIKGYL